MNRAILAFVSLLALGYTAVGYFIYQQDRFIDPGQSLPTNIPAFWHPESNLRFVRESFAAGNYSNDLKPFLEAAISQAPASYQSWYLNASFHSNRAEAPEQIQKSLEAALKRFPANGRLRLATAQWLLSSRSTLPYRTYRAPSRSRVATSETQQQALAHLSQAIELEPPLLRATIAALDRSVIPMDSWPLPDDDRTSREILLVLNQSHRTNIRLAYIRKQLNKEGERELGLLRDLTSYSLAWGDPDTALIAARRWQRSAATDPTGAQTVAASLTLIDAELTAGLKADALKSLRRGLTTLESQGTERSLGVRLLSHGGTAFLKHRDAVLAESLFHEALGLSPRSIDTKLRLAQLYRRNGERLRAMRELRQILELSPDHPTAQQFLLKLLAEQR